MDKIFSLRNAASGWLRRSVQVHFGPFGPFGTFARAKSARWSSSERKIRGFYQQEFAEAFGLGPTIKTKKNSLTIAQRERCVGSCCIELRLLNDNLRSGGRLFNRDFVRASQLNVLRNEVEIDDFSIVGNDRLDFQGDSGVSRFESARDRVEGAHVDLWFDFDRRFVFILSIRSYGLRGDLWRFIFAGVTDFIDGLEHRALTALGEDAASRSVRLSFGRSILEFWRKRPRSLLRPEDPVSASRQRPEAFW